MPCQHCSVHSDYPTHNTNCRVTRHLPTTSIHEHGRPAEAEPATAISTHHPNTTEAKANSGQKLNFYQALKLTIPPVGSEGTTVLATEF
jgi:hypothetical protein